MTPSSAGPDDTFDELDDLINHLTADPATKAAMDDASQLFRLLATLRSVREDQDLSQRDVAARMGTTQSAVSNIEGGANDPQITTLMRYARALGARIVLQPCVDGHREHHAAVEWLRHRNVNPVRRPQLRSLEPAGAGYLPKSA